MQRQSKKELAATYKGRTRVGGVCAIRNTLSGRRLLVTAADLQGYQNRFAFSVETDFCIHGKLAEDWKKDGKGAFVLDVLETLEKKEAESDAEFADELGLLKELWAEKADPALQY